MQARDRAVEQTEIAIGRTPESHRHIAELEPAALVLALGDREVGAVLGRYGFRQLGKTAALGGQRIGFAFRHESGALGAT